MSSPISNPAPTWAAFGGVRRAAVVTRRLTVLAYPALTLVALIGLWEFLVTVGNVPSYQLPPPLDVFKQAVTDADYLAPEAWVTAQEVIFGFLLSVAVGVALGVAIVTFRPIEKAIYPILVASQVVPKIALAPLILVWLGFGINSKILIAFLIAFFPIVIDTVLGLRSLSRESTYLARSIGARKLETFLKVQLPGALPAMFSGFKLAATFAVTGAVVGEYTGADRGIAHTMVGTGGAAAQTSLLYAAVVYIVLMGLIAFGSIVLLERLAIGWHIQRRLAARRA